MKWYVRLAIATGAITAYLAALRYIFPPDQPYFILGIAIVSLVAWLLSSLPGLLSMVLLVPLTSLIYHQFPVSTSYVRFASSPAYIGLQVLLCVALGYLRWERKKLLKNEKQLEDSNKQLQTVLSQVQELGGIHNMCSGCKQIKDDDGQWQSIDVYLKTKTKMEFSHCICPDCAGAFQNASKNLTY